MKELTSFSLVILLKKKKFNSSLNNTFASSVLYFSKKEAKGFPEPATLNMEAIIDLHHSIFYYLLVILLNILLWGIISLKSGIINKNISFSNKNGFFLHKTLVSQSKKKSAKELGSFLPIRYSHDSALECF